MYFLTSLFCRQKGFLLLVFLAFFGAKKGQAQSAGKAMPDDEIETIVVGAKRMTIRDILDSVAAHRQPDANPFMLATDLSIRLYNDTATFFALKKQVLINRHHKRAYSLCTDSLATLVPDVNTLSLEQQRRQQNLGYVILWDYEHIVNDDYLKVVQSFGRPVYKVDTAGENPQIHLFFFITKSRWNTRLFDRKVLKGDTTDTRIVRYHKLDIDRSTWTLRSKERGTAKVSANGLAAWEGAETYTQHDELLQQIKASSKSQMDWESISYSNFTGGSLVPVAFSAFDNFSPVAVPMLIGDAVENPEGSAFEITLSNTQITNRPLNPDYHVVRTIGLESIFKSPFAKGKKKL